MMPSLAVRTRASAVAATALAAVLVLSSNATARNIDESKFAPADIIERDVAIIGGGASGSYAAVRVKDAGKSLIIIELKDHLGGHIDTYNEPASGVPINFGVQAYMDLPGSKEFFARFGIATAPAGQPPFLSQFVDFKTGKAVTLPPSDNGTALGAALAKFGQLAAQYNDLIFPGYFGLNQVPTIPEDLLLPFGDFVNKYSLQAALPLLWTFVSGVGDVLSCPTLFVLQNFGAVQLQMLTTGGFFTPVSHNNSELYAAVAAHLGSKDVMYGSRVAATDRNATGVRLLVKGRCGKQKLVKAKRLLITIPPTKDAMYQFDADAAENALLSKWTWSNIFVGVFSGSNLPDGLSITNTDPALIKYPLAPFADAIVYTGVPGLYRTMVVGPGTGFGANDAKQLIRENVKSMGTAGTYPNIKRIDFAAWGDHSPSQLRVSAAELAAGFFGKLYALQGQKSTWFTGAAWTSDYSSTLWLFTETILPGLLAGL